MADPTTEVITAPLWSTLYTLTPERLRELLDYAQRRYDALGLTLEYVNALVTAFHHTHPSVCPSEAQYQVVTYLVNPLQLSSREIARLQHIQTIAPYLDQYNLAPISL